MRDSIIICIVSLVVIFAGMFLETTDGVLDCPAGHYSIIAAFACICVGIVLWMLKLKKDGGDWHKTSLLFWLLVDGALLIHEIMGKIAYLAFPV